MNLLENLNVGRIMIHQVYKRNADKSVKEPLYNNTLTELDDTGIFTFSQRIIQAIGNDAHSVEMQVYKSSEESTFSIAKQLIGTNDEKFIDISKKIAYNLAIAQNTRRIPEGIVVIFDGTIGKDSNKFIGIMKAEMHEGFKLSNNPAGLSLDFIRNLVLTPQQKFYKIGMYINLPSNKSNDISDYICFVYDNNLGKGINSEAAQYFYDGFLGCKFKNNNKFLTKQFYTETKDFINRLSNVSDEEKVELNYALYTYTKLDQKKLISIKDFCDSYLKSELKDDYINYMESKKFPATNIAKDLSLIESSLKNRKIKFSNNIKLTAPSDNFKNEVEINEIENGFTEIKIKGHIVSQE
ncbi:hypothetical protein CF069_03855 [Clostridium botulinum]|nr:nucleoid-associated protein [Clostridium botulinum]